jgi:hypothetical protein
MLARHNHQAGLLLLKIAYWARYGRAKIPNAEGYWVAHDSAWWARETCLSARQYDRAIAKLAAWGLIEKRQWWWGHRNILHVRPTSRTVNFLQAATTWEAAEQLLNSIGGMTSAPESWVAESGNPSMQETAVSNGFANNGNPSSPNAEISNDLLHKHSFGMKSATHTDAHSASPTCAIQPSAYQKEISGEDSTKIKLAVYLKKIPVLKPAPATADSPVPTLKVLATIWGTVVTDTYSGAVSAGKVSRSLTPKAMGALALWLQSLAKVGGPNGEENFRAKAGHILAHAIRHWSALEHGAYKKPTFPSIDFLFDNLGSAISIWDKAGRPSFASDQKDNHHAHAGSGLK